MDQRNISISESVSKKSKVGMAAYATSSEPFKVRFDQIEFRQNKKQREDANIAFWLFGLISKSDQIDRQDIAS